MRVPGLSIGLLLGAGGGVIGSALLLAAGVVRTGALPWVLYLLVPTINGFLAGYAARRGDSAIRRGKLIRVGAIAGGSGGFVLGLMLTVWTVVAISGGELASQISDLFAQYGLSSDPSLGLPALVVGCAGVFYLALLPPITAAVGALTAAAYSFARPRLKVAERNL